MTDKRKKIGDYGENIARGYLENKGYVFIERNYRCDKGEIDLIMKDGEYTVFIEVKHRRDLKMGHPCEAVTPSKQKSIIRTAKYYIYENRLENVDFRFDVFEVFGMETVEVNHIENAFWIS